jgi:glutathione synthase/RimK-type ligase-like ATP-grasp enzyme
VTASHLARWLLVPVGPDYTDEEIKHAVLGVVKAAEYTGMRWAADPGRAAEGCSSRRWGYSDRRSYLAQRHGTSVKRDRCMNNPINSTIQREARSIALVTDLQQPGLSESDSLLVAPLLARGLHPVPVPWESDDDAWESFDAVILRSCWNYHRAPDAFRAWLERLEGAGARLWNPAPVVRWNMDKCYLRGLAARGVVIAPTVWLDRGQDARLAAILKQHDWPQALVKPRIGASAYGIWQTGVAEAASQQEAFAAALQTSGLMVQQFLPEIAEGEWSLIFFRGVYSHAVLKRPEAGNIFVQKRLGGSWRVATPPPHVIAQASAALHAAAQLTLPPDDTFLYARVDGIDVAGMLVLMELEVPEPGLMLNADMPGAAERFADAILAIVSPTNH